MAVMTEAGGEVDSMSEIRSQATPARDELAETVRIEVFEAVVSISDGYHPRSEDDHAIIHKAAETIMSAIAPRVVNSATEVHSLCVGTIVRDAEGDVYELWEEDIHTDRVRPAWMKPGDEFSYYDPTLPATVLFTPGEAV